MIDNTYIQTCDHCEGTGKTISPPVNSGNSFGNRNLSSTAIDDNCTTCKGTGKALTERGQEIAEVVIHLKNTGKIK